MTTMQQLLRWILKRRHARVRPLLALALSSRGGACRLWRRLRRRRQRWRGRQRRRSRNRRRSSRQEPGSCRSEGARKATCKGSRRESSAKKPNWLPNAGSSRADCPAGLQKGLAQTAHAQVGKNPHGTHKAKAHVKKQSKQSKKTAGGESAGGKSCTRKLGRRRSQGSRLFQAPRKKRIQRIGSALHELRFCSSLLVAARRRCTARRLWQLQ